MYEIENRELQSRIYATQQLLKLEFEVTIFQHSALWLIALFAKPGFICLKSTSYQFDEIIEILARRGFRIISWQEEGLHHFHGQEQSPVFSKNSSKFIDRYFAWHPADAELAIRTGIPSSSVEIVGNLRMDLLKNIPGNFNSERVVRNRVLILTNFDKRILSYDFLSDRNLDHNGRILAEHFWAREKESARLNLSLYEELFTRLSSELLLVSRVRPYFYESDLTHLRFGIATDHYFTISESLAKSDFLIHYGSTGGIEATVLGIPNLILAASTEGIDSRILESGSFFSSVDALIEEILNLSKSSSYSQLVSIKQHECQVSAYEFDFRKSNHFLQLVAYLEQTVLPTDGKKIWFTRFKLFVYWALIHIKYSARKKFSPPHMVKATLLNRQRMRLEIWDPLKNELMNSKIKYWGRAVYFKTGV